MNQQRTRRFRAAKESVEMANLKAEKKAEIERNGGRLPPPDPKVEKFDSNCITPGTGFMNRLADALRYYVAARLNDTKAGCPLFHTSTKSTVVFHRYKAIKWTSLIGLGKFECYFIGCVGSWRG